MQYEQAKAAGRHAHRAGAVRESIRRAEGARARRRLIARAQLMGAAGGSPVADPVLGQLGSDIDRQTELDVWGIREQTWRERFAARQAIQAAKNQAIQAGVSGLSQGATLGLMDTSRGTLQGGGAGMSLGSSYVSGGGYANRLENTGTFSRARYGNLGIY